MCVLCAVVDMPGCRHLDQFRMCRQVLNDNVIHLISVATIVMPSHITATEILSAFAMTSLPLLLRLTPAY